MSNMIMRTLLKIMSKYSDSAYDEKEMYPTKPDWIFKPFRQTLYNEVKVLMLFDEPYNNGDATGLPLELGHKSYNKRSKHQADIDFFEELLRYYPYQPLDVTKWCDQGVLMLHLSFTSEYKQLNKHLTEWLPFTETLIGQLLFDIPDLVVVTFSEQAKYSVNKLGYTITTLHIINSPEAHNNFIEFKEFDVLDKINKELVKLNKIQIEWI